LQFLNVFSWISW